MEHLENHRSTVVEVTQADRHYRLDIDVRNNFMSLNVTNSGIASPNGREDTWLSQQLNIMCSDAA